MRGSYPKTGDRHDSRERAHGWITLPRKHDVKVPPLPRWRKWDSKTVTWWGRLWAMPQASQWSQHEIGLEEMAILMDDVFKGDLTPIRASAELRQWGDRFGLNPRAAQSLRWRMEDNRPVPEVEPPLKPHEATSDQRRKRLRVVG